jgi:thioredoxin-related protein
LNVLTLSLAAMVAVILAAPLHAAESRIAWRDWDTGFKEAQRLRKPVLVDVYTQWCGWCKRMDRDVYSREDVRAYLSKNFVAIKLDAEAPDVAHYGDREYTWRTLAGHFRITGYPTTIFLRSNGDHVVSVPGYVEADKFQMLVRYIGEGHLDRGVTWEEFKAQQEK